MFSAFRNACLLLAVAAIVAMSHVVIASSEPSPRVLRVCSDPNNLPFSNKAAEGFENRIATLVAERMGARLEYVWWAQRRGFIRNTLRAGLCDAVMGLPSNMEMAATTSPYYRSSYMFVTRRGTHQPSSLDDPYLAHATIGVHLIGDDAANTPPAHALSKRRMIDNVRGYSIYGDYKSPNPPAALISAVSNGDIDVAIAWGPLAGYFAKHSTVPLQLNRVLPESDPPYPFVFDVSMGVARSNTALRDELNRIVAANREQIDRILRDFGVPIVAPHTVATR